MRKFASQAERRRFERAKGVKRCSICNATMDPEIWDHNAAPVNNGRCCGDCNATVVIPARIAQLKGAKA